MIGRVTDAKTAATLLFNNTQNMKNIIRIFFATLLLVEFASCEKPAPTPEPDDTPALNENIQFTFQVQETDATSAKIQVSHNGTTDDTWVAFATDNKNINEALAAEIAKITAEGSVKGLKKSKTYAYKVSGLNPETEYTFVAFGITAEGVTYGKPATVKFTTKRGEVVMEENKAWTVEYSGPYTDPNSGEILVDHTITVKATDENPYIVTAVTKEMYENNDIKDISNYYLNMFIEQVGNTYKNELCVGSMIAGVYMEPGDWYALAIGVDAASGELSGLYAVSEMITLEEEEPTEAYSAWLGNWTFTGANQVAWDVTISKGISNMTYYLSGWEGEQAKGLDIEMTWIPEDEVWVIYTYATGPHEFAIGNGNVWILGCIGKNIFPIEGLPICFGGFTEEGQMAIYPYYEEAEDGSIISIEYMQFIADINNEYYNVTEQSVFPTFPIIVTPNEDAAPASKVFTKISQRVYDIRSCYPTNKVAVVR